MITETEFLIAFNSASGAYKAETGGGSLTPWGYSHIETWQDGATGFKSRAYVDGLGNYIIAFAGTEDLQDTYQDLASFGMGQWDENRPVIISFFNELKERGISINSIQFTGHSLGGALAQYAAYEFVNEGVVLSDSVILTTFNALGGDVALQNKYPSSYNSNLLATANIHHYYDPSDIFSKLSPHVGGQETTYQVRANSDPILTFDAHKMETIQSYIGNGLVRGLQADQSYFDIDHIVPALQIIGEATNGFVTGSDAEVNEVEAVARLISMIAIIPKLLINPSAYHQWDQFKGFLIDNLVVTTLAPKFGITSEEGMLSLKVALDLSIQGLGLAIADKRVQATIQAGATLTAFFAETYDWLTDGAEIDPADKALSYSILNYMVGATLSVDENGDFDEKVSEEVASKIYSFSNINDSSSFPALLGHMSVLLGQNYPQNYEDAIGLANYIVENGIHLADFLVPADSYTKERLINIVNEKTILGGVIVPDPLDARLVRYAVINHLPFILEGVSSEFIDPVILNDEKYDLVEESDQYWYDRIEFFQQRMYQNADGEQSWLDESDHKYFWDAELGQLLVGGNISDQGTSILYEKSVSNIKFGSNSDDLNIRGYDKDDHLYGRDGSDTINGNAGRDHIEGNADNDTLHGGDDSDYLYGGKGNDHIHGDQGVDFLYGGEGNDTYYYNNGDGHDYISDQQGSDRLVINGHAIAQITQIFPGTDVYEDDYKNTYILDASGEMLITISDGNENGTINIDWFHQDTNNFGLTVIKDITPDAPLLDDEIIVASGNGIDRNFGGDNRDQNRSYIYDAELYALNGPDESTDPDDIVPYQFDGGSVNDVLTGGVHPEVIGFVGTDFLNGYEGDDLIYGDNPITPEIGDDDVLIGGKGNDRLYGGMGNDKLIGWNDQIVPFTTVAYLPGPIDDLDRENIGDVDYLDGGQGDDFLVAGYGNDTLIGGSGDDFLYGNVGGDVIQGGGGRDYILGDSYASPNVSTPADDGSAGFYLSPLLLPDTTQFLDQQSFNDVITGGAGVDIIHGEVGNDIIYGGTGSDTIYGDRINNKWAHLLTINEQLESEDDLDVRYQDLAPSDHGDDTLSGGVGDDYIYGNGGNDFVSGGQGDDILFGDDYALASQDHGQDRLEGNYGSDVLIGGGSSDTLYGGDGNDFLYGDNGAKSSSKVGNTTIYGPPKITINDHEIFYTVDVEHQLSDFLYGGAGADYLEGDGGDDYLDGGSGGDDLVGGNGDDRLIGGEGDDLLIGGAGQDIYQFSKGDGSDTVVDADIGEVIINGTVRQLFQSGSTSTIHFGDVDDITGRYDEITFVNNSFIGISNIVANGQAIEIFDYLYRESGSDIVMGTAGSNVLKGRDGRDIIFAGDGDDVLMGGGGSDDYLSGDAGNDTYMFSAGDGNTTISNDDDDANRNDVLRFLAGIDPAGVSSSRPSDSTDLRLIVESSGSVITVPNFFSSSRYALNSVVFEDGTVWDIDSFSHLVITPSANGSTIRGSDVADDVINGLGGNDTLYGLGGNDTLSGGGGRDYLSGGDGDDILRGGASGTSEFTGDWLFGNKGSDTYLFGIGDGETNINIHSNADGKTDTLRFLEGISASDISVRRSYSDLLFTLNSSSEEITIHGFFTYPNLTLALEFADDGTIWDTDTLHSLVLIPTEGDDFISGRFGGGGIVVDGLGGNDTIYASEGNNVLSGGDGTDIIVGAAGDDILSGGTGINDNLKGGEGNDTYLFSLGDGNTIINNYDSSEGNDVLHFLAGIDPSDVEASRSDGDLFLTLKSSGDVINIQSFFYGSRYELSSVEFSDGTVWDTDQIKSFALNPSEGNDYLTGTPGNDSIDALGGNDTIEGGDGNDTLFGNNGDDSLYGDGGSDILLGGDGSDFLSGGDGDDTLSGGRGFNDELSGDAGDDTYLFEIGDGNTIISNFDAGTGRHDVLHLEMIDPSDVAVSLFPVIYGPDLLLTIQSSGEVITLKNFFRGSRYELNTVEFDNGTIWDVAKLTELAHTPTNNAPTINQGIEDANIVEDVVFSVAVPIDAFADLDGDTLSYTATLADSSELPSWLSFDGNTFSGMPTNDEVGILSLEVTASDGQSSVATTFNLSVTNVNDAPELSLALEDQSGNEEETISFSIPTGSFTDVDEGDSLTYTASLSDGSDLPAWLSFDANTQTFNGFPGLEDLGSLSLKVTVTDLAGASMSDLFDVIINNVNDIPIAIADSSTTTEDMSITIDVLSNDSDLDGDTLIVSSASASNGSVTINPYGTLNYIPNTNFNGSDTINYEVSDGNGGIATSAVTVTVNPENDTPVAIADSAVTIEDTSVMIDVLSNDNDIDGDILTLNSAYALNGSITINPDSTLNYMPNSNFNGVDTISYGVTDGNGGAASSAVTVTVNSVNDDPELSIPLQDQTAIEGDLFTYNIPSESFSDIDLGDTLTYSASLEDGSSLPSWLTFDSDTLSITGTGSSSDVGNLNIKVIATDSFGATAEDIFILDISASADQPLSLIGTGSADVLVGGNADDYINGKGRNDNIRGYAGNDTLLGAGGSDYIYGDEGNDTLKGGSGHDHMFGGEGNDLLVGGKGNDTYYFGLGDGYDRINNASNNFASETDKVSLSGVTEEDVWFKKTNNHLDVYLLGTNDHLRVNNWYKAEKFELDRIDLGSSSIDTHSIEQLVNAMASFGAPSGGSINLSNEDQQQVNTAIAAAWQ
tara:strand:- start:191 stop:8251 length:8061 start_codon:yes stop_codon:yes gene_type:complete